MRRTDNGASVVVLISDRGPFVDSRVVDVSFAAARKLGMLESGVAPVALEILEQQQAVGVNTPVLYAVQAASFRLQANAERTRALAGAAASLGSRVGRTGGRVMAGVRRRVI